MPDILHEVSIVAAPSQVFKAITEQQGLASWWTTHIVAEPKVGWMIEARFFDGKSVHTLEVLTLEPDRKVEWITRQSFLPDWTQTRVIWDLLPIENGTRILFGQRGFASADGSLPKVSYGWAVYLTSLKDYLEKGTGNSHSY